MGFKRESTELSTTEKSYIDDQINLSQSTLINLGNVDVIVSHQLIFSMIDGKICNALIDTKATQKCYLCGAISKQFNEIDKGLNLKIQSSYLQFGLSILHGWIRCFECQRQSFLKTKAEFRKSFATK
ncbi:hypothetical protein ILUMI_12278 [Ignelater luminosus]|uniref:Uncharacterized protein n=1 Tax=Ignelater luminosus TaxID=2038154 RepID=A0A8K0GBY3_IGNLU|nr:hypothetical protein ILUMI_12278 [Ignelater luminosus]